MGVGLVTVSSRAGDIKTVFIQFKPCEMVSVSSRIHFRFFGQGDLWKLVCMSQHFWIVSQIFIGGPKWVNRGGIFGGRLSFRVSVCRALNFKRSSWNVKGLFVRQLSSIDWSGYYFFKGLLQFLYTQIQPNFMVIV